MLWICDQIDHQTGRTEWDACCCMVLQAFTQKPQNETLPPMTASGNICGFCTQSYMQCYLRKEAEGMILSNNHTQMHTHRHSQTQAPTHLFWLLIKADNLSYRIQWPKCFGTLQQLSDHDLVQYLWSPSQILNLINFAASFFNKMYESLDEGRNTKILGAPHSMRPWLCPVCVVSLHLSTRGQAFLYKATLYSNGSKSPY